MEDGRSGLLFDKGDAKALAGLLIRLAGDAALRRSLELSASQGVEEYSSEHMAESVQKVYEEVLKGRL